jgi:hypothetical protein
MCAFACSASPARALVHVLENMAPHPRVWVLFPLPTCMLPSPPNMWCVNTVPSVCVPSPLHVCMNAYHPLHVLYVHTHPQHMWVCFIFLPMFAYVCTLTHTSACVSMFHIHPPMCACAHLLLQCAYACIVMVPAGMCMCAHLTPTCAYSGTLNLHMHTCVRAHLSPSSVDVCTLTSLPHTHEVLCLLVFESTFMLVVTLGNGKQLSV